MEQDWDDSLEDFVLRNLTVSVHYPTVVTCWRITSVVLSINSLVAVSSSLLGIRFLLEIYCILVEIGIVGDVNSRIK